MTKENDVLDFALHLLKVIGQHPNFNTTKEKLYVASYLPLLFLITVLVFIQFFYINGSIQKLAESFEASMTFFQMSLKILCLLIYKNRLANLINQRRYFWNVKCLGPEVEEIVKKIHNGYYRWLRMFWFVSFALIAMMSLKALLSHGNQLPLVCWLPKGIPLIYEIIFVLENILLFLSLYYVVGFDGLFGALCTNLVVQFRLLYYDMKTMQMDNIQNEEDEIDLNNRMKNNIKHHVFLLNFATEMIKIYSMFFIGQYIITVCSACMELYIISESLDDFSQLIKSVFYSLGLLVEFYNFCGPAANVTYESLRITEGIYESGWHAYPKLRVNICLIIDRAQRDLVFTAGNMLNINREAYVLLMKTSLSFFTLLRTIKEKK